MLLAFVSHVAFDIKAYHLWGAIGTNSDGLFEVTRKLALAVVGNVDGTRLAWFDRRLGVFSYCAAT